MARVLVKKNVATAVKLAIGEEPPQDQLAPGHMRLFSYYKPSLKAGLYGIEAQQAVTVGSDSLPIWNYEGAEVNLKINPKPVLRQKFQVQAPQFSLDPKLVNTFYPPDGHHDEGRILPHIVFNDPHVPWLREAGVAYKFLSDPIDLGSDGKGRNLVPWMALVTFDPEELLVTPVDAIDIGFHVLPSPEATSLAGSRTPETIDPPMPVTVIASYDPEKLPANGAYQMTVGEYFTKIPKHRVYFEAGYEGSGKQDFDDLKVSAEMTSVIFPKMSLVKKILGSRVTANIPNGQDEDRIFEGQKLLSHVRQVNTMGFPDAGIEEEGFFSVVISSRTGRVRCDNPRAQVVHLISIEHYDSTLMDEKSPFPKLKDDEKRIGLISLHSWVYTCIPQAVDFVDTMAAIATDMQPLKPPTLSLKAMLDVKYPTAALQHAAKVLHDRLEKSYTLSRWRTATGEETVAFNRGPLVGASTPTVPAAVTHNWPKISMTGKDYQVFDRDIGIMDLTYSSAWSLGKVTAISDSPFNAALLRFRSMVWTKAASNTRLLTNNIPKPREVMERSTAMVSTVRGFRPETFSGDVSRISPPSTNSVAPPLSDPAVAPIFAKAVQLTIDRYAGTVGGNSLYNDFNLDEAANSDWELIHSWISDCLYLAHIPAHYLFPEPSHIRARPETGKPIAPNLPPEALRFFFVDHSWLDCFIDGALSCANHLEPDYDSTRLRIKDVYNFYLDSHIQHLKNVSPPVPRFGFIFRSSVVKAIPDLKITVLCWNFDPVTKSFGEDLDQPPRNPVVRLTKMDDFTIMCLMDCLPEEIHQIKIAQPPHQQRYAMGYSLKAEDGKPIISELQVRMLYTNNAPEGTGEKAVWPLLPGPGTAANEQPLDEVQKNYYDENTRLIKPITIADSVNSILLRSQKYKGMYTDKVANACVLGLELSDPSYSLIIRQPIPTRESPFPNFRRQLWTGLNRAAPAHEPRGRLSTQNLPSEPLIRSTSTDPKDIKLPPTSPPSSSVPKLPGQPRPNLSSIVVIPFTTTGTPGPGTIPEPQFTLLVHVDYRTPPPAPLITGNGQFCYAPLDFLPTDTKYLYDVIFAIRRRRPQENPGYRLLELRIEMPISPDDKDLPDNKNITREPLIPMGGYTGPGARMVRNQRFVPTLYNSTDAAGKPILGVKLIPRSGRPDATIELRNDQKTTDASIRLAELPIARIAKPQLKNIAQIDDKGNGLNKVILQPRGVVKLVLRETYVMADGSKVTWVTDGEPRKARPGEKGAPVPLLVLKKAEGDTDFYNQEV
ncbi:hypothetical protein ONS95_007360 [Cadophora gregata]|uniref:uncharacterized protein n=1 Tax=Cadophora gregata TaxID=51156 RepID=UPI0026DDC700|nr:uncharacterized protein ONS95_007360 [Cadophora gregata]KAK0100918.1 hypothetical protein ONS95_007360 [Cadophora gregata]KAK0117086.1 hypothetical protein ONS96_012924 [Cadophora gregata f. sp. sojae]